MNTQFKILRGFYDHVILFPRHWDWECSKEKYLEAQLILLAICNSQLRKLMSAFNYQTACTEYIYLPGLLIYSRLMSSPAMVAYYSVNISVIQLYFELWKASEDIPWFGSVFKTAFVQLSAREDAKSQWLHLFLYCEFLCVSSDIFRALGPISTRANKASSLGQISNQTEEKIKVDIELIENKNTWSSIKLFNFWVSTHRY